jgi:hypothetical protein
MQHKDEATMHDRKRILGLLGTAALAACAHRSSGAELETEGAKPLRPGPSRDCGALEQATPAVSELRDLSFLLGCWKVAETFEAGPMGAGGSGEAEMSARIGPGGNSIIIDYVSTRGPMSGFAMHEIITWEAQQRAYQMVYVTSRSGAELSRGTRRDDSFVFEREATHGGRTFVSRGIITDVRSDSFAMESHVAPSGGPAQRIMRLEYTRR